jgi:hypothetical protein
MDRYESGSLDDSSEMQDSAELMCAALTHFLAGSTINTGSADESPDIEVAQTIWNVLVAVLHRDCAGELGTDTNRQLRLALAATRKGCYQSVCLGGTGVMAELFDNEDSLTLMSVALSDRRSSDEAPVNVTSWFTKSTPVKPKLVMPRIGATSIEALPSSPSHDLAAAAGAKYEGLRDRARKVTAHVNPLALQHGLESFQGALTEAKIAKVDKRSGKLKMKKIGIANAALRPRKTMRRALNGASLAEHLKSFNEDSRPGKA